MGLVVSTLEAGGEPVGVGGVATGGALASTRCGLWARHREIFLSRGTTCRDTWVYHYFGRPVFAIECLLGPMAAGQVFDRTLGAIRAGRGIAIVCSTGVWVKLSQKFARIVCCPACRGASVSIL